MVSQSPTVGASPGYPRPESWGRNWSRKVRVTRSSSSQKRSEPAAHPCRGPGGQAGDEHGGSPWVKGGVEPGRAPAGEGRKPVAGRVRRACDDAPLSVPVRLCDAPYLLAPGKRGSPATFPWHLFSRPTPFAVGRKLGSFPCSIPPSFVLSHNMPMTNNTNNWLCLAWFKNARFRVTLGISALTLIGPALERVYASPWSPCWGFSSARTACTPETPASERAADPSATPQDSC